MIESPRNLLRGCLLGILAFNGLVIGWLYLAPDNAPFVAISINIAQFLGPLLILALGLAHPALPWRGMIGRRGRSGWITASDRAPIFLFLGCASWSIGQIIWTIYEHLLHRPTPLPSWADLGFLGAYPLLLVGMLSLPHQPPSVITRVRVLLDGILTTTALVTCSWYFLLGPALSATTQPLAGRLITAAYPLGDVLLLVCLIWLISQPSTTGERVVTRLLIVAVAIIVVTDCLFQYRTLQGTYHTGTLLDVGWPLGYMLIGLAAIVAQLNLTHQTRNWAAMAKQARDLPPNRLNDTPLLWRSLVPYSLIPIIGGLALYAWRRPDDTYLERGLWIGGILLLLGIGVHQFFVILENWQFSRDLSAAYRATLVQMERIEHLQQLAATDPLTGLLNHRAINAALDEELDRARRDEQVFAVLVLDLDRFKALNDTYGHLAGDAALRELAGILRNRQRGGGQAGRWGGEEFVLILPHADEIAALEQGERLRETVAAHICKTAGDIRLTCSIGVAVYPQDGTDRDTLIAAADRAMYTAKCLGRNQIYSASDPVVAALMADASLDGARAEQALAGTVEAMAALVEARDHYTGEHTDEVAALTIKVALELGCDVTEAHQIALAGRLHDVGKVAVPDAILRKAGPLTDEEWALMRQHPVSGAAIISRVPGLRVLAPMIRSHHERWDGAGYPDGLRGTAIPLGARIIAVADAYGALTTDRPYRLGRSLEAAVNELRESTASQFDPTIVAALERVLAKEASNGPLDTVQELLRRHRRPLVMR